MKERRASAGALSLVRKHPGHRRRPKEAVDDRSTTTKTTTTEKLRREDAAAGMEMASRHFASQFISLFLDCPVDDNATCLCKS